MGAKPRSTANTRLRSVPRSEAANVTCQSPPPNPSKIEEPSPEQLHSHIKISNQCFRCFQEDQETDQERWARSNRTQRQTAVRFRRINHAFQRERESPAFVRSSRPCCDYVPVHTCFRRSNSASLLLSLQKKYDRDSDHGTTFRTAPLASMRPGVSCRSANCTATFKNEPRFDVCGDIMVAGSSSMVGIR